MSEDTGPLEFTSPQSPEAEAWLAKVNAKLGPIVTKLMMQSFDKEIWPMRELAGDTMTATEFLEGAKSIDAPAEVTRELVPTANGRFTFKGVTWDWKQTGAQVDLVAVEDAPAIERIRKGFEMSGLLEIDVAPKEPDPIHNAIRKTK